MAPRKKTTVVPPVEPAIEQPPEQPVIRNDVPVPTLNAIPVRVERDSDKRPSTVRRASTGKGGAKSGGGKGAPSRSSSSSRNQGTSTTKRKKKKKSTKKVTAKGPLLGGRKSEPSKKTKRKASAKRFTKRAVR
jgi:hypothetical protein